MQPPLESIDRTHLVLMQRDFADAVCSKGLRKVLQKTPFTLIWEMYRNKNSWQWLAPNPRPLHENYFATTSAEWRLIVESTPFWQLFCSPSDLGSYLVMQMFGRWERRKTDSWDLAEWTILKELYSEYLTRIEYKSAFFFNGTTLINVF